MTRILVQRGSTGSSSSSSNQNRSSVSLPGSSASSSASSQPQASSTSQVPSALKDDELVGEFPESIALDEFSVGSFNHKGEGDDASVQSFGCDRSLPEEKIIDNDKISDGAFVCGDSVKGSNGLRVEVAENEGTSVQGAKGISCPPPPPVPPPKPASLSPSPRKFSSGSSNAVRIGSSREFVGQPNVSTRTSPTGSRPSSPRSHCESEGYNSADEQNPNFGSSRNDVEREHQFEIDIRRAKGLEVKKMREDGNCLFRAVADQVYGDSEAYDLVRRMCIDYMEHERDHFSQFITEGFTSYCKRKRRDKVYGNNVEIQALSEMYNRPIHIYSYSIEPMNTFHGSYNSDTPPIRLSYHHGNHYNSLVDPRRLSVGAGLGFSCLRGKNIDKDKVKAAIKAQQDQHIDNALLAEGRFYSDLELTEKEMERMAIEASRAEYIAHDNKFRQQLGHLESSTSGAEPSSSSGTRSSGSEKRQEGGRELCSPDSAFSDCIQVMLSMGFSYPRVIEAYSIFGDEVDSMQSKAFLQFGAILGFLSHSELVLSLQLHAVLRFGEIMSQNGKLMPNLDQNSTKLLNLTVLQRIDPFIEEILITAAHVTFYEFNIDNSQWSRKDVEGSLFVVKRSSQPRFQFIVMNRRNTDNLVEDLLGDFEYEIQVPYLLYRNATQEVNGIWFYNQRECEEVANLFDRILGAYSKVPTKSKVPLTKSEFEELEAVPTMAVIDGPLEPSSSTASNAPRLPEDNCFVNFFSNAMTIGNASSTAVQGQLYHSSPVILPPPRPPASVPPTSAPVLIPSPPLSTSSLLRPLLDAPEPDSSAKWSSNLVKPSSFFGPPPASSPLMPPVSSSVPTAPPLLPLGNLQRPYGAPLLQPFPPPTPPPSLTPTSAPIPNYGPVVSRDKVREALVMLVQDDQFIDMVYRAVLNAHHS